MKKNYDLFLSNAKDVAQKLHTEGNSKLAEMIEELVRRNECLEENFDRNCEMLKVARWARDEAREQLDLIRQSGGRTEMLRPEPSRLEIAAILKSGWLVNSQAWAPTKGDSVFFEQADSLIAASKETK